MFDYQELRGCREGNRLEFKKAKGQLPRSFREILLPFRQDRGGPIERTIPDQPTSSNKKYRKVKR